MTPQSSFMILAPIEKHRIAELRDLLGTMTIKFGQADPKNELVPFGQFDRLHVARFVILEALTSDEISSYGLTPYPWQPALAFLGDCDGNADAFLVQLVDRAGPGLIDIFSYCKGFVGSGGDLLKWMNEHSIRSSANYINWIGRTVKQVHEEVALHRTLSPSGKDRGRCGPGKYPHPATASALPC